MQRSGRPYVAPTIPKLPEGNATFLIASGNPTALTLASIQAIHDLYNHEHDRLQAAFDGREQARLQQDAELKAHPPKPQDIVLNHWDIGGGAPVAGGAK